MADSSEPVPAPPAAPAGSPAAAAASPAAPTEPPAAPPAAGTSSRRGPVRALRWIAAFLLALLGAVLVVGSVTARYARAELLDTERYVATVAPLASDPQVQAAVTARVTDEIMARLPIATLAADLATAVKLPRAQSVIDMITPAVSSWLEGQIHKVVGEVVASPQFARVWTEVNRTGHQNLEGLLTGQGGPMLHSSGTDVVVDLGPVLAAVRQELVDRGFTLAARIPDMSIPYTVAQIDQLPEIQKYVRWLDLSATWLPPLALALLGLAVWTAPNRRRGLILGLLLSGLLLVAALVANQVVRDRVALRATERGLDRAVTLDVYDTVLRFLLTALVTVLVAALLGVLWALLAGPSRPAVLLRRGVNSVVDRVAGFAAREPWAVRTGAFVRRHFRWFAVVLGVLAAWWLLARPSVATAVWAFVGAAAVTLLLTLARRMPATVREPLLAGPSSGSPSASPDRAPAHAPSGPPSGRAPDVTTSPTVVQSPDATTSPATVAETTARTPPTVVESAAGTLPTVRPPTPTAARQVTPPVERPAPSPVESGEPANGPTAAREVTPPVERPSTHSGEPGELADEPVDGVVEPVEIATEPPRGPVEPVAPAVDEAAAVDEPVQAVDVPVGEMDAEDDTEPATPPPPETPGRAAQPPAGRRTAKGAGRTPKGARRPPAKPTDGLPTDSSDQAGDT